MNRLVKNASWIIGCKVAQTILSFVVSLMTARYLGPSNYGLLNYASSLVTFITPIMTLGFTNILVQEFVNSPDNEGEILGTSLLSCFCSSLLCMLSVVIFSAIANPGERNTTIVTALFSINLLFQALELSEYWFQAKLLSKYTSVVSLVSYTIVSTYKIYLLITGKSIYWFAVSYAIDYMIIAISLLVVYKKIGGQSLRFSLKKAKAMFSKSRYYIISSLMITIFTQTDKIMIKPMLGDEATGFYSTAVICAGMTSFVFAAIIDSFRPAIFESKQTNQSVFELNIKRLYSVVIYLSIAQCVAMTLLARLIIHITYGDMYEPAVSTLRIVVWYTTFSYLGNVRNIWILAESKQRYLWIINMIGAIANVILNFIMIPLLGINGAALASLITQCFTNFIIGFIITPIRYNNYLMLRGLNPRLLVDIVRRVRKAG